MLEALDRVNVRDLILDELHSFKPSFNPESEISDSDWRMMLKILQKHNDEIGSDNKMAFPQFIWTALDLKLLCPGRANNLPLDKWHFEIIQASIFDTRHMGARSLAAEELCRCAYWGKNLFPDRFNEFEFTDSDWSLMRGFADSLRSLVESSPFENKIDIAFNQRALNAGKYLRLLFPEQAESIERLGTLLYKNMHEDLEEKRVEESWGWFSWAAANLRLFLPGKKARDFGINAYVWSQMVEMVKGLKRRPRLRQDYPSQAVHLAVLAADEIEFSKNGILLHMSKPKFDEVCVLIPERRKF